MPSKRPLEYYRALWATMELREGWHTRVCRAARLVMDRIGLYHDLPAPWELVGVVHYMECGSSPECQIINGERWDFVTGLYPQGLGPFDSWRDAALVALKRKPLLTIADVEAWNGWGYARRNMNSPYIWSGTNYYESGKYVEREGKSVFEPKLVSQQAGVAPILRALGWQP